MIEKYRPPLDETKKYEGVKKEQRFIRKNDEASKLWEQATPKDFKGMFFEQLIEQRYDELLTEREQLEKKLANFQYRDFDVIGNPEVFDEGTIEKIANDWLSQVNEKTWFLKPLKSLGINIFQKDLENQPEFPDTDIIFASTEIVKSNIMRERRSGGHAVGHELIETIKQKPNLRGQLLHFLINGEVDETTSDLTHELIHSRHHYGNIRTNKNYKVLTEAQAYLSDPRISKVLAARIMTKDVKAGGLYEFNTDQTIQALNSITILYGIGLSYDEISKIIINSSYDPETKKFLPLEDIAEQKISELNLKNIDADALYDIYKLGAKNQRIKAQLLLYQTISESKSVEELRMAKIKSIREMILYPVYYNDPAGTQIAKFQDVVCPCNNEFPYDPHGNRTGIVFGLFPREATEGKIDSLFGIGVYNAKGDSSQIKLTNDIEKTNEYIETIKETAKNIKFDYKANFLSKFMQHSYDRIKNPVIDQVLIALITPEELRKFINGWMSQLLPILETISDKTDDILNEQTKTQKDISSFKNLIESIKYIHKVFDMNIGDIEPELKIAIDIIQENISAIEKSYPSSN